MTGRRRGGVRRRFLMRRTRPLDHLLPLAGARVAPLLAQQLAALGGQLLKAVEVLPHVRLLLRGQRLESLPAAAQVVALFGGERAEALEAIARLITLRARHPE